jgi:thiol-disulfide isomerase/thioredoxin
MRLASIFTAAIVFASALTQTGAGAVFADDGDPVRLTVHHTPEPVPAVVQADAKSGYPVHYWHYRTEIRNDYPFPLRIVRYGFQFLFNGEWADVGQGGSVFDTAQFTADYTSASPVVDGWVGPGQTAADDRNWSRSVSPVPHAGRWFFDGADSSGHEYRAVGDVELWPFAPEDAPWSRHADELRLELSLRVTTAHGGVPARSQLRFDRLYADPLAPPAAVYAWSGADMPGLLVAAPGLYRLHLQAAGHQPVSLPIVLDPGDGGPALDVHPVPIGQPRVDDSTLVEVDAAHGYLRDVWALHRRAEAARDAHASSARAYQAAHDDMGGFTHDWGSLPGELTAMMTGHASPAARRFAAWTWCATMPIGDATTAGLVVRLLPPSSPLWFAGPDLAVRAAYQCGELLDQDLVAAFAVESPDHHVRATAIAGLARRALDAGDTGELDRCRELLDTEYADVKSVDHTRRVISRQLRVIEGQAAPAYSVRDLETGEVITNATFAGRYCLVHFWASWCGPCREEMEAVHAAHEAYGARGLEILSLSLDNDPGDVAKYRQGKWKLPWTHAYLEGGTANATARDFEVFGIPRLVLVGPDGVIVATDKRLRADALAVTLGSCFGGD